MTFDVLVNNNNSNVRFTAIIQVNRCWLASPVKKWRDFLEQNFADCMPFTARIPLLTASSEFGLGRRH